MPVSASIVSEQTLQVGTNGPGDVTTMYVVSGIANANLSAFSPAGGGVQSQQATFAAHVGPSLTTSQFRKAIGNATIASLSVSGGGATFAAGRSPTSTPISMTTRGGSNSNST